MVLSRAGICPGGGRIDLFKIHISGLENDPRPVRIEIVCNQCGRVIVRREMSIEENVTSASLFGTTDGKAVTAHSCESPHPELTST